jgi:hypothetical protein
MKNTFVYRGQLIFLEGPVTWIVKEAATVLHRLNQGGEGVTGGNYDIRDKDVSIEHKMGFLRGSLQLPPFAFDVGLVSLFNIS